MIPPSDVNAVHVVLAAVVLVAAVLALYAPRRMTAVVLFLIFGVLLSGYWAMIGVPDVALAEAVIGTGVTGALFGWVATLLPETPGRRWVSGRGLLGLTLGTGLGAGLGVALVRIVPVSETTSPAAEPGLGAEVERALPATGVEHGITGVLLNLRSFDTLMEMVVLLVAVVVALAFVRSSGTASNPQPVTSDSGDAGVLEPDGDAAPLLRLFVRLVAPVALLLAAWVLFAGSSQPGGAFQAGAAGAAVLILLHASRTRAIAPGTGLTALLVVGVLGFVAVGVGGLVLGESWLMLRGEGAGVVTVVLETLLAVSIGASLAVVFLASARGSRS